MEKFVPHKKLSKKQKRELGKVKRLSWGLFSPVTRKSENSEFITGKWHRNGRMIPTL